MKKSNLFAALSALLLLASCGAGGEDATSDSSSNPAPSTGNTLSSVLSSFGKNCRVNNLFQYLSTENGSPASVLTDYVEDGFLSTYKNFGDKKDGGIIDVKNGTSHFFTVSKDEETKKDVLTLGNEVKKDGSAVTSFRDVYYDPSYVGENVAMFTAENVFVPKIKGTTFGTFNLYGHYYSNEVPMEETSSAEDVAPQADGDATLIKDNTAELLALSKALGVYEVAANYSDALTLESADLYFSEKGTQYTFNFYYSYHGGYDRLVARSVVSRVGEAKVALISDYNA